MSARSLNSRERGIVTAGIAVAVVAIVVAYLVLPFYKSWVSREARIQSASNELANLSSLIRRQDSLLKTVTELERTNRTGRRVLAARTTALAASDLQRLIRIHAERSRISIDRLEFSSADQPSDAAATVIPFTLSAVGDIYGITEFLALLRTESPVVDVSEVNLVSNSALKGGLIQFSATVLAPVVIR